MKYYKEHQYIDYIHYDKLICKNNKYFIDNVQINNNRGINNDIVYYNHNEVINIKERAKQYIVGILLLNNNKKYGFNKKNYAFYLFKPINKNYPEFLVASNNKTKKNIYVAIEFHKWDITSKYPIGHIIENIGETNILENQIRCYLYKNNLVYPKIKLNKNINNELVNNNKVYNVFSIDPPNCKDIDDCISFNKLDNNNYEIGIHITDVSHYINNIELFYNKLTTSIYYGKEQINMLPKFLSENMCSLLENNYRKCISTILIFNNNYELINHKIELTNVYIEKNLSYDEAETIIEKNNSKYIDLIDLWKFMIKYDTSIKDTHELIEKLMVLCNKIIAETLYIYDKEKTILRIHEKNDILLFKNKDEILTQHINKKKLNAATYSYYNSDLKNTGHSGLNLSLYTHFTSPIRRYIDIINHINIKNVLNKKELIKVDDKMLDNVNKLNKNIKKFTNDYKLIELLNIKKNILNEKYEAYIIKISINYILIYIPILDIEYKYKFYDYNFKNIYSINVISNNKLILKDYNNNKFIFENLKKINILVTYLNEEVELFNKIKIKLI